jgi:hypothetical protein
LPQRMEEVHVGLDGGNARRSAGQGSPQPSSNPSRARSR